MSSQASNKSIHFLISYRLTRHSPIFGLSSKQVLVTQMPGMSLFQNLGVNKICIANMTVFPSSLNPFTKCLKALPYQLNYTCHYWILLFLKPEYRKNKWASFLYMHLLFKAFTVTQCTQNKPTSAIL